MQNDNRRFHALMEPTNRWAVWDQEQDCPAMLGGAFMSGLPRDKAILVAELLNATFTSKGRETRRSA